MRLVEKLQIGPGAPGVLLAAPPGVCDALLSGPEAPTVWQEGREALAWGLAFCRKDGEVARFGAILDDCLVEDGLFWMAYETRAAAGAPSRDEGWRPVKERGYLPIREIAIDARWSALRFRRIEAIALKRSV